MKKLLMVLLVQLFAINMLSQVILGSSIDETAPLITGASTLVQITGITKYCRIIPDFSGSYTISSSSSTDPVGYLYDSGGAYLTGNDDYSSLDFRMDFNLTSGSTYYIGIFNLDGFTTNITLNISGGGLLPVELTSFSADLEKSKVLLNWQTATEVNNYGFEIERTANNSWEKIGFVEGHGNSNSAKNYSFQDSPTSDGVYSYRLKQIDFDGKFEYSSVVEVNFNTVTDFALEQNYPNPFNPTTSISYSIPKNEFVTLKVYDVIGNEVATLVNTLQESGKHEVNFNASNLSSGIYFYKLTAGNYTQIMKMMLVK